MLSFKKKKYPQIPHEELEILEYAQKRIRQRKNLYTHFVIFLIGSVFLLLANKVFKYGAAYDWALWAILAWCFFLVVHGFNVLVTHRFMGPAWERSQRERLVARQRQRIGEIQKEIETEFPLSGINKKKEP